jgi:pimeloyl-ACP methyl ester carboxylesterase
MLNQLSYKGSKISYLKFGKGNDILFAFHGFNETAKSFLAIEPSLGERFTIIAFDFPNHGLTEWNEDHVFGKKDAQNVIDCFLKQENISRFSVMGFSMGGKWALSLTEAFPDRIDRLILMAADGIKTNKWFNIAMYPAWSRKLFKMAIRNPGWLFLLIKLLRRLRIASKFLYEFTTNHLDTEKKRWRIYHTWMSLKEFAFDIDSIKKSVNENEISVSLIFGKYDEVIPPEVGEFFQKDIDDCQLTIIKRGHYFVDQGLNRHLENLWK